VSTLRLVALVACLVGCSGSLAMDAGADGGPACCPIDEPIPGACVTLGGAPSLMGGQCQTTCDGPNDFVRTIDELGCPKLVPPACADGSADPVICR